ncbi:YbfB/YjiJ family MFS transporter [Trichloromonas sp.]|uniref:YbfB/YjiJ family MFS transporter n=1 Tax=Trichloromonas sp. TaxID=3069249 RepID=UPI003D81260B
METENIDQKSAQHNWAALKVLAGGILGMMVVMGIGRFAYTPILPLMQRDLGMSHSLAGGLAGLNYLGYLAGAVICTLAPRLLRSRVIAAGALLLSLATTTFMGATVSEFWWGTMRLGGGLASAVLFIVISAEVAETLARRGYGHWFGALYGGVGFGIALSGLVVPQLDKAGGWDAAWIGMGGIAGLLALLGAALGRRHVQATTDPVEPGKSAAGLRSIRMLAAAYFLQGMGYIVTATFIVAIIAETPGLEAMAPYSWVAVGLSAIPSTILWPHLARRTGNRQALLAAYTLQAAGILVSVRASSIAEVLFAAVTFGGTFLGIVALTLAEGKMRMGKEGARAAAFLTASFSVGQVLGPIIAGSLADRQDGFALPLLLAAGCIILGGLLIVLDRGFSTPNSGKESDHAVR